MNWSRGFLRVWVVLSALWVLTTGYFATKALNIEAPFHGTYQHSTQLKKMPWETDWSKPLYDIAYAPGKGKFRENFSVMTDDLAQQWQTSVNDGKMVIVDFPDHSRLYITSDYNADDKELLARIFWEQRWERYGWKIAPWLALVLVPPIGFLLVGMTLGWIFRGFRRST